MGNCKLLLCRPVIYPIKGFLKQIMKIYIASSLYSSKFICSRVTNFQSSVLCISTVGFFMVFYMSVILVDKILFSCLLTSTLCCLIYLFVIILGCIMVAVVIFSRKCDINPDNVATPIAASLGDLTTLCLLAGISCVLYGKLGKFSLSLGKFVHIFVSYVRISYK